MSICNINTPYSQCYYYHYEFCYYFTSLATAKMVIHFLAWNPQGEC